jgi:hypothetical protein
MSDIARLGVRLQDSGVSNTRPTSSLDISPVMEGKWFNFSDFSFIGLASGNPFCPPLVTIISKAQK